MKSLFICSAVIVSTIATSCIYDAPGDKFFRTLWISEGAPLETLDASSLTLEFLCDEEVSITITDRSRQITGYTYGRYSPENMTAVLEGLRINIQNIEVTFIEAHRDGNTLFLVWKIEDSAYQFTTTLQRKSSYN